MVHKLIQRTIVSDKDTIKEVGWENVSQERRTTMYTVQDGNGN